MWLVPPPNVWRHLRNNPDSPIVVWDVDTFLFCLELLKAMYGFVDGPILFQLALLHFLVNYMGMSKSIHDDNFLYRTMPNEELIAVFVIHVDDIFMVATRAFLNWACKQIEKRFGALKTTELPFVYIGMRHTLVNKCHLLVDQEQYLAKLKTVPMAPVRRKALTEMLSTAEHFSYRSLVCSMLWLCLTRMDIISEVCELQQYLQTPQVLHLVQANNLLLKSARNKTMNGLHYRYIHGPVRVLSIADAGQATRKSVYAQEGRIVGLASDRIPCGEWNEWTSGKPIRELEGPLHPYFYSGKKASKTSHSTSHAESNSAISTLQMASLVAHRLSEPFMSEYLGKALTPRVLLACQLSNVCLIPVDHITDCMDLYELCCGEKGVSSDKNQRLVILSLREDRLRGIIRVSSTGLRASCLRTT